MGPNIELDKIFFGFVKRVYRETRMNFLANSIRQDLCSSQKDSRPRDGHLQGEDSVRGQREKVTLLACSGCRNKVPQAGRLEKHMCYFVTILFQKSEIKVSAGEISSEASLLGLPRAGASREIPVCVCVPLPSFCHIIRSRLTQRTSS